MPTEITSRLSLDLEGPPLAPDPSGIRRLPELDALRGLAAVSVALLHFRGLWIVTDPANFRLSQRVLLGALRFFYCGSQAVILFFILSGMVLALLYLRGRNQSYPTFLLRRILRIWGPYVVALGLAVACDAVWHNHIDHGDWVSKTWSEPLEFRRIFAQVPLIWKYDSQYLPVSWTLTEEMRISFIFPALALGLMRLKGALQLLFSVGLSVAAGLLMQQCPVGSHMSSILSTVSYVGFFGVGLFLASHLTSIRERWLRSSKQTRLAVLLCTFVLYTYNDKIADLLSLTCRMGPASSTLILLQDG